MLLADGLYFRMIQHPLNLDPVRDDPGEWLIEFGPEIIPILRKRSFSIPFGWMLLVSIDFAFTPDGIFPLNEDASLPFAYPIHKGDLSRMKAGPEHQWSQSALHMRGINQFSDTGFQPYAHFHLSACFHEERIKTPLLHPKQLIRFHV